LLLKELWRCSVYRKVTGSGAGVPRKLEEPHGERPFGRSTKPLCLLYRLIIADRYCLSSNYCKSCVCCEMAEGAKASGGNQGWVIKGLCA
jgi:hypothetical protein